MKLKKRLKQLDRAAAAGNKAAAQVSVNLKVCGLALHFLKTFDNSAHQALEQSIRVFPEAFAGNAGKFIARALDAHPTARQFLAKHLKDVAKGKVTPS